MTHMLFRAAEKKDKEAIYRLANQSGVGITTLAKDMTTLKERLAWSCNSFNKKNNDVGDDYYLFVLEDPSNQNIVGTSAIKTLVGHDAPFYSYKLSKRTRICHALNIRHDYEILTLVNDNQGCSEVCTLYLDPAYRIHGNGLLLSRARFLFIAEYAQRFSATFIAEMRGYFDEQGNSPFWDNLGAHFFHMPFEQADRLTLSTNKQFISDLMPRGSIYVKLLSPEAQAVIGKPHPSTMPAMHILHKEGFRYNHYVDIFDAGPTIEAPRDAISSIAKSKFATINTIIDEVDSRRYIVSTTANHFRATLAHVLYDEQQKNCIVSRQTAELLQIKCGDKIRFVELHMD